MLSFICCRWEAISVYVGRLHVEIRTIRWADAALSQAHGPKAVQVPSLSAIVLAKRPFVASHEEALMKRNRPQSRATRERKRTLIDEKRRWETVLGNRPVISSDPGRERETDDDISYIWDLKSRVASRPVPNFSRRRTGRSDGQQLGKEKIDWRSKQIVH